VIETHGADEGPAPPPPEGYAPIEARGGYARHNGPFFRRPSHEGRVEEAFWIRPRHTNGLGILHGGMVSSFLDRLLGTAVGQAAGRTGVTVQLSVDFLRMARAGEWLQGSAQVTQVAQDLAFAEGRAFVGEREVARATGVFKLMSRASAT
jgi:uncharacterized protein (TIGR00369 family)